MANEVDLDVDLDAVPSPTLRRLIEEVRREQAAGYYRTAYDRTYHRYNRTPPGPWGD